MIASLVGWMMGSSDLPTVFKNYLLIK